MELSLQLVVCASFLAVVAAASLLKWRLSPLYHLPTLGGPSVPLFSYLGAVKMLVKGQAVVDGGYRKYFGGSFKVPFLYGWVVVVTNPSAIEDLKARSTAEVSLAEGLNTIFPTQNAISHPAWDEHWEVDIIRGKMTRSVGGLLSNACDELSSALTALIPTEGAKWATVGAMEISEKIVVRAASRAFIGLPLCRNQEYLDLIAKFAHNIANSWVVSYFLPFVTGRPFKLGPIVTGVQKTMDQLSDLIMPVIQERRSHAPDKSLSSHEDEPNDMLQWCIEEASTRGSTDGSIVCRILSTNFAAFHTSTLSLAHILYDIAAHPEYLQPLREEVEEVVASDGWTKAGLNEMRKIDSFVKESHRWNALTFLSVFRKTMKDITLVDGTKIPKGTMVAAPASAIHHDEEKYARTDVFDPFRFAHLREQHDHSTSHQFSNTSLDWLAFGHGRNACPGRFFASGVLKAILAHLVLNYDIKLVEEGKRPPNFFFMMGVNPNLKGKVMFRRRQGA